MKNLFLPCLCGLFLSAIFPTHATDLKRATVTQVVNDVQVISGASQTEKNAVVNDVFAMPDILRTGTASRAELVANDDSVTRVGANTIFSFDPANRTIDLKQGCLLFHSPHGKGGGSIHTGSATASVLGSTLIVSATPNGGFKVISLEDEVNIKLPDGKHQTLNPGQMTYILPGGKHLAPIVLFRLDDLIMHSLLVKGFEHPLKSMPLIDYEIDQQNKLIKSGKLTDTGLLAGNNANAEQVEVLDANTVQSAVNSKNVQNAFAADATINQPSLEDASIPTPPNRIFLNQPFTLAGNRFFAGQTFRGFAARNISFINPTGVFPGSQPPPLTVDMSPYANKPEFDFVAAKDMNINNSVTFSGLSPQSQLSLIAGNQMTIAQGITLTGNVSDFELATSGNLSLDGVTIVNNVGDVGLTSGSAIDLNNITIFNAGRLTLTAANAISIVLDGDAFFGKYGSSGDNTFTTTAADGQVNLGSRSGSLTVTDTSIQTHFLTLNSGDSILLDSSGQTLTTVGAGATANFTAPNLITVNNTDLSGFGVVNMAANTITLNGVAFGANSIDSFGTKTGQVNVNGPQVPGGLNFFNSTYGGTAITSPSQITLSSGPGTTPGIYSYAK